MPPFRNFKIWRGRLPHWRADDVCYYVTFRHRRALDEAERRALLRSLLRPDGSRLTLLIVCVLPEKTDLIFEVCLDARGRPYELSKIVEAAKRKASNLIVSNTGEGRPLFFAESFDRIIRDELELEERWDEIFGSPVAAELAEDPEDYEGLWVAEATDIAGTCR